MELVMSASTKAEPYCKHCGNAAQDMLEVLVNSDTGMIVNCSVCSKTSYILKRQLDGKNNS